MFIVMASAEMLSVTVPGITMSCVTSAATLSGITSGPAEQNRLAVVNERTVENAALPQPLLARTRQKYCVFALRFVAGVKLVVVTSACATMLVNAASVASSTW